MSDIKSALLQLDPTKDEQWTSDGQPRLDALKALTGDASLTREKVEADSPGFTRDVAAGKVPTAPASVAPDASKPWAPSAAPVASPQAEQPKTPATVAPVPPPAPKAAAAPLVMTQEQKLAAIDAAQDAFDAAEAQLEEIDSYLKQGNDARVIAAKKLDDALKVLEAIKPKETHTDAVQEYLASQRHILEGRGQQIAAATKFQKENGIKLTDLLPKMAPIDQAMARRNTRGSGRPFAKK